MCRFSRVSILSPLPFCLLLLRSHSSFRINVKNCNIWKNSIKKVFALWRHFTLFLCPSFLRLINGKIKLLRDLLTFWYRAGKLLIRWTTCGIAFFELPLLLFSKVWFVNFQFMCWEKKLRKFVSISFCEDVVKHLENLFSQFPNIKQTFKTCCRWARRFEFAKFLSFECLRSWKTKIKRKLFHSIRTTLTPGVIH